MTLRQIKTNILVKIMTFLGFGTMSAYCLTGCDSAKDNDAKSDPPAQSESVTGQEPTEAAPLEVQNAPDTSDDPDAAPDSDSAGELDPVIEASDASKNDEAENTENDAAEGANETPYNRQPTKYGGFRPSINNVQVPMPPRAPKKYGILNPSGKI